MPRCSSAVGWVWLCAWGRRTVRSCSSPKWWRSEMTGRCTSRCSTAGGPRRPRPAGRPASSWRWWWPGWGPGCTARSCLSQRRWSPEVRTTGMPCSTQGTSNLQQEGKETSKLDRAWVRFSAKSGRSNASPMPCGSLPLESRPSPTLLYLLSVKEKHRTRWPLAANHFTQSSHWNTSPTHHSSS